MKWLSKMSQGIRMMSASAIVLMGLGALSEASAVSVYYVSCYRAGICQSVYGAPPCDGVESISGYLMSTSQTVRQNPTYNSYELTQGLSGQLSVYGTKGGRPEVRRTVQFSGTYQNLRNPAPSYSGTIVLFGASAPTGDAFTFWASYSPVYQTVQYLSVAGRSSYAQATCNFYEM